MNKKCARYNESFTIVHYNLKQKNYKSLAHQNKEQMVKLEVGIFDSEQAITSNKL